MKQEEIDRLKQMLASENESDINLAGVIIKQEILGEQYETFKQLLQSENFAIWDILEGKYEKQDGPGIRGRTFTVKLEKDWFNKGDVIQCYLANNHTDYNHPAIRHTIVAP